MKTIKLTLTAALFFLMGKNTFAADLCVAENGGGGCYSTITAAINAAANGDRIIIAPKSGGAPYTENLSISKSLQFLCNVEGGQWVMQGNVTVTPAAGREITLIGMKNLSGNITATGNSPVGNRCKVTILNCELVSGYINFDYDYFDITTAATVISNGNIVIRFGRIIGNDVTAGNNAATFSSAYCAILVNNDGVATNDSIVIVGNKITSPANSVTYSYGIKGTSSNQYYYISNNLITNNNTAYVYGIGIDYTYWKNSSLGRNSIINNTVSTTATYGGYVFAINLGYTSANTYVDVINNLVLAPNITSGSGYSIYGFTNAGMIGLEYNFMNSLLVISGIPTNPTNVTSSSTTLNANGTLAGGSDAINGGSPDEAYYDINLTRNDAGAYGGSFTLDNFFPITGSARVYFVKAPRKVLLGGTLDVKADSFDR